MKTITIIVICLAVLLIILEIIFVIRLFILSLNGKKLNKDSYLTDEEIKIISNEFAKEVIKGQRKTNMERIILETGFNIPVPKKRDKKILARARVGCKDPYEIINLIEITFPKLKDVCFYDKESKSLKSNDHNYSFYFDPCHGVVEVLQWF